VALALEAEGLIVSSALKFPVTRQTAKASYVEMQTHGYEVDLVAARSDRLVLASVKSYFGSRGVAAEDVDGTTVKRAHAARYMMLNDPVIRDGIIDGACDRFGYQPEQVEMRLYAGRFAGRVHEQRIREWAAAQHVGSGPIQVFGADDVVRTVRHVAGSKTYRDNAALAALKVLEAAGALTPIA
jgi:hypothetical protein